MATNGRVAKMEMQRAPIQIELMTKHAKNKRSYHENQMQ